MTDWEWVVRAGEWYACGFDLFRGGTWNALPPSSNVCGYPVPGPGRPPGRPPGMGP